MKSIIQKVRGSIAAVRRVKNYLDDNTLLLLYHTLVMSHISYCISAWCYGNKTMVNKIQRQANQFIRIIFGLKKNDSVKTISTRYNLLSVDQLCYIETALFMYIYKMKLLPQAFDNIFQARNINHSYGSITTRTNSDFPSQNFPNMYNEIINAVQGALGLDPSS